MVVLKNCEPEISYILAARSTFKICLKESSFPDCWKVVIGGHFPDCWKVVIGGLCT